MQQFHLVIEGMSCGHCVSRVRKTLQEISGVHVSAVQIGSADAEIDPTRTSIDAVVRAVTDAGYPASASATRAA
jgi:Cu+-exporting ATPase